MAIENAALFMTKLEAYSTVEGDVFIAKVFVPSVLKYEHFFWFSSVVDP